MIKLPSVHVAIDDDGVLRGDVWAKAAEHLPSCPRDEFKFVRYMVPEGSRAGVWQGRCKDCGATVVVQDGRPVADAEDTVHGARLRLERARLRLERERTSVREAKRSLAQKRQLDAREAKIKALVAERADLEGQLRQLGHGFSRAAIIDATNEVRAKGKGKPPTMKAVASHLHVSKSTLHRYRKAVGLAKWPPE